MPILPPAAGPRRDSSRAGCMATSTASCSRRCASSRNGATPPPRSCPKTSSGIWMDEPSPPAAAPGCPARARSCAFTAGAGRRRPWPCSRPRRVRSGTYAASLTTPTSPRQAPPDRKGPATASPGTWLYRPRLFLRRYRWGVAAATMAMLAAASMTTLHVSRITHERDRAQAATARAEAVSELLIGMFDSADPAQARGKEVTVRDVMDHAAAELEDRLAGQPALLAEMDHIIGGVYVRLGEYEPAGDLLRRGLELRRQLHGPHHPDVSESLHSLAVLAWMQGRHDDAETMLRDVLARRLQALGPDPLEVARGHGRGHV